MKKATIPEEKRSLSQGNTSTGTFTPASKIARILDHLMRASLNRFEAEQLGDHCLHSTISKLHNDHGLLFSRVSERVANNWGHACQVTRYSLSTHERIKAGEVLALLCRSAPAKAEAVV